MKKQVIATCAVGLSLAATVALAAGEAGAPVGAQSAAESEQSELGEVVVTAQRRSSSLERTPVAIAVVSGDALVQRAVVTESDLQAVTPGLTVRASTNSNQLNYALRGQSLDAFSGTRPGVLPYVDEVQIGGGGGASAFYDLSSVQLLKGPQGTLFGRNSTGGAVLFTTAKPTDELEGYIMGRAGNYDLRYVEGALNVPIVADKVLLRISGFDNQRHGYQQDTYEGLRAGEVDRYGMRASLTIKFTDSIKNEFVADYFHSGGNSVEGTIYSLNSKGAVPLIALTNFGNAAQFDAIISGFVAGAGGPPNVGVGTAAQYAAANPRLDPGGLATYLATQRARGPYVVESNSPNAYHGENTIISNITTVDIADDTQIRNVIGHTKIDNVNRGDVDATPYGIDDQSRIVNLTKQFSEELQLVGKTLNKNLSYVTGLYYANESNIYDNTGAILTFPIIASQQSYAAKTTNKTYAGYGQGTYDLSDLTGVRGFGVTAGARYTDEKVGLQTLPSDVSFSDSEAAQATYQPNQTKSYKNTSWTVGFQEQLNNQLLLYVASRRSYRNGGYNTSERPVPGLGVNGGDGYDRETVTDLEFGAKYQGSLIGMPVRANIALYNDWIENSQRVAYAIIAGSPAAVTVNVPRASVKGVEFDGSISPFKSLTFGSSANYTNAAFTDNLVSVSGGTPVEFGTYPDTARWSGTTYGDYAIPVSTQLALTLHGDVFAQTSTFFSSTANTNPGAKLPGYKLVNFRISLGDEAKGWSVSFNMKNALNEVYYVGGIGLGELFQFNTAVPGEPRTFFGEARYKF